MNRVVVLALVVFVGASCDVGTLNPEVFHEGLPYTPSDRAGGEIDPACTGVCNLIGNCYPARAGVRAHCESLCSKGMVNLVTCNTCLYPPLATSPTCADLEAGACQGACGGGSESLTAESSWSKATIGCGTSWGCVSRPGCSTNMSSSPECNSGCCSGNMCVPGCACSGMLVPSGC